MSRRQEAEWRRQQEKEMRASQKQAMSQELRNRHQQAMGSSGRSMRSTRSSPSRSQGSESFGMHGPMPGYDQYGNRLPHQQQQPAVGPMTRYHSQRQQHTSVGGSSIQSGDMPYGHQQQQAPQQQQNTQAKKGWGFLRSVTSAFSSGPSQPPTIVQGTWSGAEGQQQHPGGGGPSQLQGGPYPRSSSGTGTIGGPNPSQGEGMAVSGGGDMLASGTSLPQQRQQQQQQQLPQGLSEPSASSSSAQVRDLQHRISVLESQLQEVDVIKRQAASDQRATNDWREKWNYQNFKLNVMVDMLVLRVLELDGSGGRLGNNEATFGGKGGGGPVILKRGEMKVEDF